MAQLKVRCSWLVNDNSGGHIYMEQVDSCMRSIVVRGETVTIPYYIKVIRPYSSALKRPEPSWEIRVATGGRVKLSYDQLLDFVRWMCEGYTRHDVWPPSYLPFVPYVPLSELRS